MCCRQKLLRSKTEKTELKEKPFRNTGFTKNTVSMAAGEKRGFVLRKKIQLPNSIGWGKIKAEQTSTLYLGS